MQYENHLIMQNVDHYEKEPTFIGTISNKQRIQLQHEIKLQLEKSSKRLINKCCEYTNVTIWKNIVAVYGENFLTEPERFVAKTAKGKSLIRASRQEIIKPFINENVLYLEEKLNAKCIFQLSDLEPEKEIWIYVLFFNKLFIDLK